MWLLYLIVFILPGPCSWRLQAPLSVFHDFSIISSICHDFNGFGRAHVYGVLVFSGAKQRMLALFPFIFIWSHRESTFSSFSKRWVLCQQGNIGTQNFQTWSINGSFLCFDARAEWLEARCWSSGNLGLGLMLNLHPGKFM